MKTWGTLLVGVQLIGIGLTCGAAYVTASPKPVFGTVAALGVCIGLYTLFYNRPGNFGIHPTPLKSSTLVTGGPYRFVRHPMYLSVIVFLLGLALYAQHLYGWIGLVLATGAVLGKAHIEEAYMAHRYPEYPAYQARTKRIVPFLY